MKINKPGLQAISFVQLGGHANLYNQELKDKTDLKPWFEFSAAKWELIGIGAFILKYSKQIPAAVLHIFWLSCRQSLTLQAQFER